jgi:hypothetical protein
MSRKYENKRFTVQGIGWVFILGSVYWQLDVKYEIPKFRTFILGHSLDISSRYP